MDPTRQDENARISPGEWVCAGQRCHTMGPVLRTTVTSLCRTAQAVAPGRVEADRWVRYTIALDHTAPPPPEVTLAPVTDAMIAELRGHPDQHADQLRSGLRFWDHGLRRAYLWQVDGAPACIQWLLLQGDIGSLHALGEWGGMYAPLPDRCGQVENLFAFSTARGKGVATRFEFALFHVAREMGLEGLVTHIHEGNAAARAWAGRTGWREYGLITRYHADVPGLRGLNVCLHTNGGVRAPSAVTPEPLRVAHT